MNTDPIIKRPEPERPKIFVTIQTNVHGGNENDIERKDCRH